MSSEEFVRRSLALGSTRRGRSLDERLRLRTPAAFGALSWPVLALPPRSQLRQRLTNRSVCAAIHAYNRRDFDVVLTFYHRDVEIRLNHIAGIEGEYDGHDGWRRYWRLWFETWQQAPITPVELLEFRDRVLMLGLQELRAVHNDMELTRPLAQLWTLHRGLVIRHEEWFDHATGLEAAGAASPEATPRLTL